MPTKAERKRVKVKAAPAANKKLSRKELKKIKGGFAGGINWGDGSQTGFTPPFPPIKK